MNEIEAKRVFDCRVALCRVFGGDLKQRCLETGMSEQVFDSLLGEYQRITAFIDKHDSEGNVERD